MDNWLQVAEAELALLEPELAKVLKGLDDAAEPASHELLCLEINI